ncbi:MAG: acetylglutamate kinase [Flammeovirgaceae bacterium]|nr:acetylglutamate kinase [Flammeovirgaceae bacterium]
MEKLSVIKIGGNIVDNPEALKPFLEDFSKLKGKKILIHGGGKIASEFSKKLGITPNMHNGRRITDAASLDVVTMVYSGLISKNIVADLQALKTNAIGLTGADLNVIQSEKRPVDPIDFGFVGDVKKVNVDQLRLLIDGGTVPILNSITHDNQGTLLNTNADTIAAEVAIAASNQYQVELIYCFEKNGVLTNPENDDSWIDELSYSYYQQLLGEKIITAGMMPKLENCFNALKKGVIQIKIIHAKNLTSGVDGQAIGTCIFL